MASKTEHYKTLKLTKSSSEEAIKKSYKKLAMLWHPDKNSSANAESKFKQINEAYDILSDPIKRQIYDLYGAEGVCDNDNKVDVKCEVVELKLVCSLEDLCLGSIRKMKISRTVIDSFSNPMIVEEILKIDIKPGWKKGTKITFPGKGNEEKGMAPGDLIFVIEEKSHDFFKRDGNDLVVNKKISLLEALTGKTLDFVTLDGRKLSLPITNIIKPGYEVVLPNEGMPISKEPGKKGNLKVKFDVKFPSRLSDEQKVALKRLLTVEKSVNVSPVRTRIEAIY